jgi:type IV pilus assembly protein PilE
MIVVAIIGILAAVAYPNYRDHVIRGYLTAATTGLSVMRADMERYYQNHRTYASVGAASAPPCLNATTVGHFTLACTGADSLTDTSFKIAATGSGAVNGFIYSIDHKNNRHTEAVPVGSGYNTCTSQAAGWMLRKGQSC